jgi:phosphoenolpyruvate-protein kinase (PTS system EI component)
MKKTTLMTVIAFGMTSLFMGCEAPTDKVNNSRENVAEAQRNLADAKRELKTDLENFRRETEVQLSKNRNQITELRGHASKERIELRDSYNAKIMDLENRNLAMETRLKDFRSENNNEWLNFKRDFSRDMDDLGLALTNLGKDNVSQR